MSIEIECDNSGCHNSVDEHICGSCIEELESRIDDARQEGEETGFEEGEKQGYAEGFEDGKAEKK